MATSLRSYTQKLPGLVHTHQVYFLVVCELAVLYAGFNLALSHVALFIGALEAREVMLSISQAVQAIATIASFSLVALVGSGVMLGGMTAGRRLWRQLIPRRHYVAARVLGLVPFYSWLLSR